MLGQALSLIYPIGGVQPQSLEIPFIVMSYHPLSFHWRFAGAVDDGHGNRVLHAGLPGAGLALW